MSTSGSGVFSTDSPMTAPFRCVMLKEKKPSLVHMDTVEKKIGRIHPGINRVPFILILSSRRKQGGMCGRIKRVPVSERGKAERDF